MWRMIWKALWLSGMGISDAKEKRVPVWMLGAGAAGTVLEVIMEREWQYWTDWKGCLALVPGVLLLGAAILKKAGYVDGIVLLLLGITENVEKMTGIFWGSLLLLSVFGGGLLILRRGSWRTRLPYLPFLTVTWMMVQGLGGKMPI